MEEPNEVIDTNYIEKLEKHIESTKSNIKYSIDRFDILIIAICSGGLVFSLNFVKNILVSKVGCDFILVKISTRLSNTAFHERVLFRFIIAVYHRSLTKFKTLTVITISDFH